MYYTDGMNTGQLFDTVYTVEPEEPPDLSFQHPEPSSLLEEVTAAIKQLK